LEGETKVADAVEDISQDASHTVEEEENEVEEEGGPTRLIIALPIGVGYLLLKEHKY
jgi:hypothetical protein